MQKDGKDLWVDENILQEVFATGIHQLQGHAQKAMQHPQLLHNLERVTSQNTQSGLLSIISLAAPVRTSGSAFVSDAKPWRNWHSRALASWKSQCCRHTAWRSQERATLLAFFSKGTNSRMPSTYTHVASGA